MTSRALMTLGGALAIGSVAFAAENKLAPDLSVPVRIEADGKPIDVEVGHAAPFFGDFDRDGVKDLLVGQFGDGKLRIYKNVGTNDSPRFKDYTWFKAGAELGTVPAG